MALKLNVTQQVTKQTKQVVSSLGWTADNKLYTVDDDKHVNAWDLDGTFEGKATDLDAYPTDFAWQYGAHPKSDTFAVGCSDGSFRLMNKIGRLKVKKQAHQGALTCLAWNSEGNSLATAGEDGRLIEWSDKGNLRSNLLSSDQAIYSIAWAPNNQSILYSSGKFCVIKPLHESTKQVKWRAHNGVVLSVDWNPVNNLIVSGGEDCRYRVWSIVDDSVTEIYACEPEEYPITSVKWCPNGEYFAFGSFDLMSVCDKTGWVHSRTKTQSGSVMQIDWTADGTHLAGAGANGMVCFGQIVDRTATSANFSVKLNAKNQIEVFDCLTDDEKKGSIVDLEFGDRVVDLALGFNNLVVVTTRSCYVYGTDSFSTPHILEISGNTNLILQAKGNFLLSTSSGINVYSYAGGRKVSSVKVPNLRYNMLKKGNVSLSSDVMVLTDHRNPKSIHVMDVASGKPLCKPLVHEIEVIWVALSQAGGINDRLIALIDANRDLFIAPANAAGEQKGRGIKVAAMVDSLIWHDACNILAFMSDGHLIVQYYPNAALVDKDLAEKTKSQFDAAKLGKNAQFVSFQGSRVTLRRSDGALQATLVSPFPAHLHKLAKDHKWDQCARLCRTVDEPVMWGCLAVMALDKKQLEEAEIALAAIDEMEKLAYVSNIRKIPSEEGRNAELLLYSGKRKQAERVLLQADLTYRAIDLNIRLFNWDRALALALKHKTHINTVLAHRNQYLTLLGVQETDSKFRQVGEEHNPNGYTDWKAVDAAIAAELQQETARGTPYRSKFAKNQSSYREVASGGNGRRQRQAPSQPQTSSFDEPGENSDNDPDVMNFD